MFIIIVIENGNPGITKTADSFEDAVDLAVELSTPHAESVSIDEIRDELEQDTCWSSNQGDVWVHILMPE